MEQLLSRLKKVDPETYSSYAIQVSAIRYEMACGLGRLNPEKCNHVTSMAILQAVLQAAVNAHEWFYGQFNMASPGPYYGDISDANNVDRQWTGTGNSPSEALLKAYLEAIEAQA